MSWAAAAPMSTSTRMSMSSLSSESTMRWMAMISETAPAASMSTPMRASRSASSRALISAIFASASVESMSRSISWSSRDLAMVFSMTRFMARSNESGSDMARLSSLVCSFSRFICRRRSNAVSSLSNRSRARSRSLARSFCPRLSSSTSLSFNCWARFALSASRAASISARRLAWALLAFSMFLWCSASICRRRCDPFSSATARSRCFRASRRASSRL